jgi:hypothetical protein
MRAALDVRVWGAQPLQGRQGRLVLRTRGPGGERAIAGLLFGAGQQEQTTIETDGGNLIKKTIAYHNSGGTPLK